jgi:hypothetical protein
MAEGGLVALAVAEHLDPFEQEQAGLGAGGEAVAVPGPANLPLDRRPEGLHRGVDAPKVKTLFQGATKQALLLPAGTVRQAMAVSWFVSGGRP